MKAALIWLGIRGFNPKLKRAAGRLNNLRTPEGEPIPPNTLTELRRDMLISNQQVGLARDPRKIPQNALLNRRGAHVR